MEQDFIITKIFRVHRTTIYRTNPWHAKKPRQAMAMALVRDGVMLYQNPEGVFRVAQGDVLIVTPCEHDSSTAEGESVTYDYIDFLPDDTFVLAEDGIARVNHSENAQTVAELFDKIRFVWESHQPGYRLRCMELLYGIFHRIALEKYQKSEDYRKYRRIIPAVIRIERGLDEQLSCNELAELCGLSVSSLNRLFVATTGRTPMQYLYDTRIEYAKGELARGSVSIGELAERCGYADIYAFSHAFKRATGVAPSEWC